MHSESHPPANRKLVFLDPVGGKTLGGGEMVAAEVLMALASRGWDITLVTPPNSGLSGDVGLQGKVEILPLELNAERQGKAALIKALWRICRLSKQKPDAVWYGNTYRSLKWLAAAKVLGDVRTVCHLHESHYEPYYWARTGKFAALTDSFICISETVRRELLAGTRQPALRAKVIYNGVENGSPLRKTDEEKAVLRRELALPTQPLVCLVGRSDPLKGHDVFLRAAAIVAARIPEVRFLIVGGHWDEPGHNPYEGELKALCHALKLDDKVQFLPHRENVRRIMRSADMVVIPSRSEGFGRVAIEAMMEQTPVVASSVGGLGEIIRSGMDGILVEPDNAEQLAGAIADVLSTTSWQQQLVTGAWQRANEDFSQQAMVEGIERELLAVADLR